MCERVSPALEMGAILGAGFSALKCKWLSYISIALVRSALFRFYAYKGLKAHSQEEASGPA